MALSMWVFLRAGGGEFVRVTARQYHLFWRGEATLPFAIGSEALIAEMIADLVNRVAVDVRPAGFRRYALGADGLRTEAHRIRERSIYCAASGSDGRGTASATARFARRELDAAFIWHPTDADLDALAVAVNRRARRHVAGRSVLRLVE